MSKAFGALVALAAATPAPPTITPVEQNRAKVLAWLGLAAPGEPEPDPTPGSVAIQFAALTSEQRAKLLADYFHIPA